MTDWDYYWRCAADSHGNVGLSDWMELNEHARSDGAPKRALKPAKGAASRGLLAAGPGRITSRGTDFSTHGEIACLKYLARVTNARSTT